jgi:DNA-binding Lrp family transcriptional regulator
MAERVSKARAKGSRAKPGVVAVPSENTSSPPKARATTASARAEPRNASIEQRRRRRGVALDDADLQIMEILALDGRVTNRAIAAKVGLKEVTVASRIRALNDRGVLGVTAVFDWEKIGYGLDFWVMVEVEGGAVGQVATEIARLPAVHAVHVVLGSVDLIVHVLTRDRAGAVDFLTNELLTVRGIRRASSSVTLEMLKYDLSIAQFPVTPRELVVPSPVVDLDEHDYTIINALIRDGRQSNRQIAREIGLSDGTVRLRLRRLEEAGMLRILGQIDPTLAGHLTAWACIGLEVHASSRKEVAMRLTTLPEILLVAFVSGRHDMLIFAASASRAELVSTILDQVRSLEGVRGTETWDIVKIERLDYNFGRLL